MTSVSDNHTDPVTRASIAISADAERLLFAYRAKAALATELCLDSSALHHQAHTNLVEFTVHRVRPYLTATDRILYATAARAAETWLLVRALRGLRESLTRHLDELAAATTPDQVSHSADALGAVLDACLDLDQTVLLPALAKLPGTDLPALAHDLHALLAAPDLSRVPHS